MTIVCLGALLAGLAAALLMPFLPFACAVVLATAIGAAWMVVAGAPVVHTAVSAIALLFSSQIGYGAGVLSAAFVGHTFAAARKPRAGKRGAPPVQSLRTGNEPR